MAKQKSEFSFLDLDKELSKIAGFETGSILAENTFSEVDDWIPTGNYLLNAQLSGSLFGGIPNTRSLGLMGDPGTGKSFVCLNVVREAQKKGYDVIKRGTTIPDAPANTNSGFKIGDTVKWKATKSKGKIKKGQEVSSQIVGFEGDKYKFKGQTQIVQPGMALFKTASGGGLPFQKPVTLLTLVK